VHGETPVLDTLADITAASVQRNSLAPRELMLVRIAALIAVDAPPASYFANAAAAADSGITADDIQAIMIGVAPVVGTARVVSAGGNILRALGFAIAVADAEMAGERCPQRPVDCRPTQCGTRLGHPRSVLHRVSFREPQFLRLIVRPHHLHSR
jgi:alkylhydroperoxidase/carboxymuconolactone decarboxylase family protein YurZ